MAGGGGGGQLATIWLVFKAAGRDAMKVVTALNKQVGQLSGAQKTAERNSLKHGEATDRARKATTGLTGATSNLHFQLVALGGALAAANAALGKFTQQGGRMVTMTDAFNRNVGDTSGLESLRRATYGLISDFDLLQQYNKGVALGAIDSRKSFNELAEGAIVLGRAMNVDAAFALESLTLGIGRQSRLFLDNLGLIVKVEEAYRRYGIQIGKVGDQLTEAEQKEAFRIESLRKIKEETDRLGGVVLHSGDAFTQFAVEVVNAKNELARMLAESEGLKEFFLTLRDIVRDFTGVTPGVDVMADRIKKMTEAGDVEGLKSLLAEMTRLQGMQPVNLELSPMAAALRTTADNLKWAGEEAENFNLKGRGLINILQAIGNLAPTAGGAVPGGFFDNLFEAADNFDEVGDATDRLSRNIRSFVRDVRSQAPLNLFDFLETELPGGIRGEVFDALVGDVEFKLLGVSEDLRQQLLQLRDSYNSLSTSEKEAAREAGLWAENSFQVLSMLGPAVRNINTETGGVLQTVEDLNRVIALATQAVEDLQEASKPKGDTFAPSLVAVSFERLVEAAKAAANEIGKLELDKALAVDEEKFEEISTQLSNAKSRYARLMDEIESRGKVWPEWLDMVAKSTVQTSDDVALAVEKIRRVWTDAGDEVPEDVDEVTEAMVRLAGVADSLALLSYEVERISQLVSSMDQLGGWDPSKLDAGIAMYNERLAEARVRLEAMAQAADGLTGENSQEYRELLDFINDLTTRIAGLEDKKLQLFDDDIGRRAAEVQRAIDQLSRPGMWDRDAIPGILDQLRGLQGEVLGQKQDLLKNLGLNPNDPRIVGLVDQFNELQDIIDDLNDSNMGFFEKIKNLFSGSRDSLFSMDSMSDMGIEAIGGVLSGGLSSVLNSVLLPALSKIGSHLAKSIGGLFGIGESKAERDARIMRENLKALQENTAAINKMVRSMSGGEYAGLVDALQKYVTYSTGNPDASGRTDLMNLSYLLKQAGLSLEEYVAILEEHNLKLDLSTAGVSAALDAIGSAFDDFASRQDLMRDKFEIFDIENPAEQFQMMLETLIGMFDPLDQQQADMNSLLRGVNLENWEQWARDAFSALERGDFDFISMLDDVSLDEFRNWLVATDKLAEEAMDAADGLGSLNEQLRNVPTGFKVALAQFKADSGTTLSDLDATVGDPFVGLPGTPSPYPNKGGGGSTGGIDKPQEYVSGNVVNIENLTVVSDDPEDMLEKLTELARRQTRRAGVNNLQLAVGSTGTSATTGGLR